MHLHFLINKKSFLSFLVSKLIKTATQTSLDNALSVLFDTNASSHLSSQHTAEAIKNEF